MGSSFVLVKEREMLQLERRTRLSVEEKKQCEQLVRDCHKIDQTYRLPYLDNFYNTDSSMPSFT